jgi:hypothetical protein
MAKGMQMRQEPTTDTLPITFPSPGPQPYPPSKTAVIYPDSLLSLVDRLGPPEAVLRHEEGEIFFYPRDLPRPPYAVILGMNGPRAHAFLKGLEQWWLINKEMRLAAHLGKTRTFEPLLHAHFDLPANSR